MRVHCPECKQLVLIPDGQAGGEWVCPFCAVPFPVPKRQVAGRVGAIRRTIAQPSALRLWLWIGGTVLVVFLLLGVLGIMMLGHFAPVMVPPNARCRSCGCEFRIAEVSGFNDAFRFERCPACGTRDVAGMLLREFEKRREASGLPSGLHGR